MDKKRLTKYLIITFLITWVCWWGDALLVKITSLTQSNMFPMVIFTMGGFGPTIAACFCMEEGTFVSWLALESFFISEMSTNILMRVL